MVKSFSEFLKEQKENDQQDYGKQPYVVNIESETTSNNNYRKAIWTGEKLQLTLMSIDIDDDIGLEIHEYTDQFLRVEQGEGLVQIGTDKENLDYEEKCSEDSAIFIPKGYWHNVVNKGNTELKLYSIYAPPHHSESTIHETKEDSNH